jgi:hypothetical protein
LHQIHESPQEPRRTAYGDWSCRCGISYRFLVVDGERVCWPKNGHESFRVEPAETCIGCGWDLREPPRLH